MRCCFQFVHEDSHKVVIRDTGHDKGYMSVTNDIENVLKQFNKTNYLRGRRLFYYDSEGELTEALHLDGELVEYLPGDFWDNETHAKWLAEARENKDAV